MIGGEAAKRAADTVLGLAAAAVGVGRHAAWFVSYHVRGEARKAEPDPRRRG